MNSAVIGIGSNIDPKENIEEGKRLLSEKFNILKFSRFVKTPPKGNLHQPEFINGGVLLETKLSQSETKDILKGFEVQMGRTNAMHCNKPRIIDFDIHVWNGEVIDPFFYEWDFLRSIVLEVLPSLKYDRDKVI